MATLRITAEVSQVALVALEARAVMEKTTVDALVTREVQRFAAGVHGDFRRALIERVPAVLNSADDVDQLELLAVFRRIEEKRR